MKYSTVSGIVCAFVMLCFMTYKYATFVDQHIDFEVKDTFFFYILGPIFVCFACIIGECIHKLIAKILK